MPAEMLPLTEAAMRINSMVLRPVSYHQLRSAIVAGAVPATRRGAHLLVAVSDLAAAADLFAATPLRRTRRQATSL